MSISMDLIGITIYTIDKNQLINFLNDLTFSNFPFITSNFSSTNVVFNFDSKIIVQMLLYIEYQPRYIG